MLIAYLDEFGHVGPYISSNHRKFFHHPVFGYAGFVIPAKQIRPFGSTFEYRKERQFRAEIVASGKHSHRWEKKGSEILTTGSWERYPENRKLLEELMRNLRWHGGNGFFYGQLKPVGTELSTGESATARSVHALKQALKYLANYAEKRDEELLVMLDSVTAKMRQDIAAQLGKYIYSSKDKAMRRIVEIPMQIESNLYGTTQFADWIAAVVTRTTHYHFAPGSEFSWAPGLFHSMCQNACMPDSRIWIRDSHRPVGVRALGDSRPWHASSVAQAMMSATNIGALNPGLMRLRNELEAKTR